MVTNVSMCAYVYVCVADEQGYTLRDAEAEVLFGFSLEESLKRANSVPLFKVKLASLWNQDFSSINLMGRRAQAGIVVILRPLYEFGE